ncbi:hypothetical protein JD844_003342 [Phrynosoma platyrhinos]|uniref:Carrier domain-containing protein n=1 Tax=Phrynosoma platyrhinos TaxID=52577 RepID=A0ABQ7TD42_PHRPL|nr:hypothetical protein JD844_003342 [Phrynosoma platyrhinos]
MLSYAVMRSRGMQHRLGEGLDSFWKVLENGKNCTIEIPPERFNIREWYDPDNSKPGKIPTTHAALLDEFNVFDNQLFGINKEEAEHIDPQQKLLLECTYRALEDAGVTSENISSTKTGVFVGLMNRDYDFITSNAIAKTNHYNGTASSTAANRISYTFNLNGPSLVIDTGHSSFLSALHLGYQAIKQGDCEAALCGGVNCIIDPWKFVSLSKTKMVSSDGINTPFSRKADGYGRGEGCGVLLLKSLIKAQEDFNKIWCVISITAVNQNGKSVNRMSQIEQEKLLLSIYPAHIDPSAVQYIETHSTGNPAQDVTEAESLGNIIGKKRLSNLPPLKIGSVTGNIGHTESAAGAAGLIKVLLMMHHGKIVPSLHLSESTSSINAKKLNLSVPTTVEKWDESTEFGRVAGINSFDFEGNNIHMVVRQVKQIQVLSPVKRPAELVLISAVSAKDKDNIAFVEIGSHRELQTYITETLGSQTRVFHSMQIDREYLTLLNMVKDLFELGFNVDWQHFYEGYQSVPAAYPRYQFEHKKLTSHQNINHQVSNRAGFLNHPLIFSTNGESSEFICIISEFLTPYYVHKNHNVALIAGAFFVELALAAVVTKSRPKMPLCFYQLNIIFTEPFILNENSHVLKVRVESQERLSDFRILSEATNVVYVSGQITKNPETSVEEKIISFKDIFHRCRSVVSEGEVYEVLAQFGIRYSPASRQLHDVFYCEDLKEAITTLKVNRQLAEEMHRYHIHPLLLDCFLQMAVVLAKVTSKNKIAFLSGISSLVVGQSLQEEMMIYIKTSKSTDNYLQFCGCFTNKHGSVLVELKGVQISFVKETPKNENDFLFENNWKEITSEQTMQNLPKAPRVVVFADKSGIAQQLKNYLHSESRFVPYHEWDKMLVAKRSEVNAQNKINLELQGYQDVLFMWGIQKLNESLPEKVVKYSVRCCEAFRQVVIALREKKSHCSITIITYRTSEGKVDHINPGFALYGMTRACMSEVPEISFQIIDISSTNTIDISALADVLVKYKAQDYPEVWIDEGRIYTSEIRHTQIEAAAFSRPSYPLQDSELCILYTANPYDVKDLSANVTSSQIQLNNHSVEVQIQKISMHSEDYFPVSVSSCKFGKTLYWNSHSTGKHKLLALDFSGIVTATGVEVKKIKVGDHIASCYPVSAVSKINIPETICFNTQKFPLFRNVPCISFFWVARVVLHQMLPVPKHGEILGIISIEPESFLCKVLAFSAQELGWKTVISSHATGLWQRVNQCSALIFMPPLNEIFQEALTCLFHLKDIVLVYGNEQPECLRNVIGNDHENIHIHTVNVTHIFQKASLLRSQKEMYTWLKSMNMKQLKHLPFSPFQQADKRSENTVSYFNCKNVPVIVLASDKEKISDIPMLETDRKLFKQNAVYIITGGLTGLGLETVKFVAQNGGGRIVILSRRNPSAEMQKELNDLQDHCQWSRIVSLQCNVIIFSEVEKAMKSINKFFPNYPVKGIFHSAMVLHDGNLEALTVSHFEEVLNPKIAGAINLHHAMQGQELDHFVCYSSFLSFLGNATQTNYAAANSFLDLFCHYRRNNGLSGQSINWGALNLGVLQAQHQSQSNALHTKGLEDVKVNDIHEYLRRSLILNNPQQAIVKFNFKKLACHVLSQNLSLRSRFYNLISEEMCSNPELTGGAASRNLSLDGPVDYITSLLKTLIDTIPGDLSLHTPFSSLGIDSALAFVLQNRILVERRVEIPLAKLLDPCSTVATLILHLKENSNTADSHVAEDIDAGSWL